MLLNEPAVLDACVLYPVTLCDTVLRAAEAGLYVPHWTAETLDELQRNLADRIGAARARHRIAMMRSAFPDAEVHPAPDLVARMQNHPNDRHVLAGAVVAGAKLIVTSNLRHFPPAALAPYGVVVRSPDAFLLELAAADPDLMEQILADQAASYDRPSRTVSEVLDRLVAQVPSFVAAWRHRFE